MGRNKAEVDTDLLVDLIAEGMNTKSIASLLGVSAPTVLAKIEELKKEESALLAYDKTKHLDLIGVQQRILANVTDEKLAAAPVQHLASSYAQFGKMLLLDQSRPTEIHGLMGYLIHLEKEDIGKVDNNTDEDAIDISSSVKLTQLELDL